ncbi:protoporphyrinogen/coproporphyrinogen oxidase [Agrococcus sp. Marseille-P2731]|uniref:protoporphyrinogen/coproporphyrinogen oxidase n=1 Tax=Agrococcus sp. Marseille-P2731 TaxID=1841862 RepID=UPI000930433D|nr:FAD-dependent oxidoreductase [Agrococcus sp. Marseille-P2731]
MTEHSAAAAAPAGAPEPGTGADASARDERSRFDTIVAGAGIAGLTVAHDLAARGYRVLVLEAADRIGGTAAKLELPGIGGAAGSGGRAGALAIDAGAESFAVRGGAVAALATELGLGDAIVDPNPAGAWLQLADRAVPLPKRTLLGIPSTPLARDVIDALGWGGALRAYLDRLMPVLRIGTDDALGPLVRRRMGQKVLDRLVAPLAGGVYSADPELLDVATVAPGLNGGVTRAGSLSGGVAFVLEERAQAAGGGGDAKPGSAVQGLRGGIHQLPERLAERAVAHHAEIRTGVRVLGATETATCWAVETDAGTHHASSLVVALPEAAARALLSSPAALRHDERLGRASAQGPEPEPAPQAPPLAEEPAPQAPPLAEEPAPQAQASRSPVVELVTLVFPPGAITGDPRGTGVLVAADNRRVRAKAMTHATAKWPWLREAAAGREIVRLSYGAGTDVPATEPLDDAAAAELALDDARAIFGTALPRPVASARVRWHQGQPSSIIGGRRRQQELRNAAAERDNLFVVGAAVAGTGLAQVVPDARRTALEIRRERFAVEGTPWTADIAPDEAIAPDAAEPAGASDTTPAAGRGEA